MVELYILGVSSSDTPKIDISSATITLGASLTYSGSEQTQTVTSVVVNGTTLVENTDYTVTDNTGINAGDYTLSVVGMGNYIGTATQAWSIAKANGSVSLSPTSLSLDTSNLTGTITVTRSGDGAITARSSNTSIATVSVSGTSVTVTAVASGNATVTVNVAAGMNYKATSRTASVSVLIVDSILANNSPATIQAVAQAGTGEQYWSVGDVTEIIPTSDFSGFDATNDLRAFIIGFNHNSDIEGAGIHFQFGKNSNNKRCAFFSVRMKSTASNSGGWNSSIGKGYCSNFLSALPTAWQNVIASTTKYSDNTGGGSNTASYVTSTSNKVFMLAEYEVFGTRRYANSAEKNYQKQYALYANGNGKVMYKHNAAATTSWWLRSVHATNNSSFLMVSTSGAVSSAPANGTSISFSPAFRIA